MAEGRRENVYRDFRGMARERILLEAIGDFRRRGEEGQGSSFPPTRVQRCRAGAAGVIRNLVERHLGDQTTCSAGGRARGRGFPPSSPPHPGRSRS